jgi:hypothetical protein
MYKKNRRENLGRIDEAKSSELKVCVLYFQFYKIYITLINRMQFKSTPALNSPNPFCRRSHKVIIGPAQFQKKMFALIGCHILKICMQS